MAIWTLWPTVSLSRVQVLKLLTSHSGTCLLSLVYLPFRRSMLKLLSWHSERCIEQLLNLHYKRHFPWLLQKKNAQLALWTMTSSTAELAFYGKFPQHWTCTLKLACPKYCPWYLEYVHCHYNLDQPHDLDQLNEISELTLRNMPELMFYSTHTVNLDSVLWNYHATTSKTIVYTTYCKYWVSFWRMHLIATEIWLGSMYATITEHHSRVYGLPLLSLTLSRCVSNYYTLTTSILEVRNTLCIIAESALKHRCCNYWDFTTK